MRNDTRAIAIIAATGITDALKAKAVRWVLLFLLLMVGGLNRRRYVHRLQIAVIDFN